MIFYSYLYISSHLIQPHEQTPAFKLVFIELPWCCIILLYSDIIIEDVVSKRGWLFRNWELFVALTHDINIDT